MSKKKNINKYAKALRNAQKVMRKYEEHKPRTTDEYIKAIGEIQKVIRELGPLPGVGI